MAIEYIGGDPEEIRRESQARYEKELQRDNVMSFVIGVLCIAILIGIPTITLLLVGID